MTKAIHIDAQSRTVTLVVVNDLSDLQRLIGGFIERAPLTGVNAGLYVNEEGRINGTKVGFMFGRSGIIAGNGVLVGLPDKDGWDTDVALTVDQVVRATVWVGQSEELKEVGADITEATGRGQILEED